MTQRVQPCIQARVERIFSAQTLWNCDFRSRISPNQHAVQPGCLKISSTSPRLFLEGRLICLKFGDDGNQLRSPHIVVTFFHTLFSLSSTHCCHFRPHIVVIFVHELLSFSSTNFVHFVHTSVGTSCNFFGPLLCCPRFVPSASHLSPSKYSLR